ncbi:hypothetical protein GCM10014715_79570 [Streptomyces spiralis]|uniref:Uncharacterized protein n=1 Tax=Streptomyces spiralis TaxID=66376 RepID=A0A919AJT9_9ACTN|nr:hypothetical protein [Streptomyces spiralis]GHF11927.1 hypothetical protein GCM10014715_79570 [Streptomyces spiralis]
MRRQDLADALDTELMERLLPASAVRAVDGWLSRSGAPHVSGVGDHAVEYVPVKWAGIEPWPDQLSVQTQASVAVISRAQVVAAARAAVERGDWHEALVASYVWGQGRTGYGSHRLKEILTEPNVVHALAQAAAALREGSAVAAYRVLHGAVRGLGPAFFTKFLYFLSLAMDVQSAPRALILDQRVARVLRVHATRVGLSMGLASAADVAAWIWSDSGWTPHRYEVYLHWMTAAAGQLASSGIGGPNPSPDLLELALFQGVWDPMA